MKKHIATLGIAGTLVFGASGVVVTDRAINPYEDKSTHYELSIVSDIPQGERVEISKDKAQMDLVGWNDEYRISIKPQIPTAPTFGATERVVRDFEVSADRPLLSKKMEYKSGDVTAFIEPKEGTENEFDIDFILDSKPDTNVFTYVIEGAEEFDFWYQPELTQQEIDEGASRPDNVTGSYAVYHKSKANHRVGSTNYATGKAFHIYRPKAIDADNNEVWAELDYVDGVLSVTVPDKFLETATYPVIVDPTFGYEIIGGTASVTFGASVGIDRHIRRVATFTGTAQSISVATSNSGVDLESALYTGVGTSVNFLDNTERISASAGVFNTLDLEAPVAVTSGDYYLAVISSASSLTVYSDTGGTADIGGNYFNGSTFANWTDPITVSLAGNTLYSVYFTVDCTPGSSCYQTYDEPGTYQWTVPVGVTSVDMACWGAGGGGDVISTSAGGGGGGGAFASTTQAVTPSDVWTVIIGAKGVSGTSPTSGGNSSIALNFATSSLACGGTFANGTTGGAGGTTACSIGTTERAGGTGGNGNTTGDVGGGGGGAAGPQAAGGNGANGGATAGQGGGGGGSNNGASGNASGVTGGTGANGGGDGGNGGNGGGGSGGVNGVNGGGGGGGGDDGSFGNSGGFPGGGAGGGETDAGARGGPGQCVITYTVPASASGFFQDIIWFNED